MINTAIKKDVKLNKRISRDKLDQIYVNNISYISKSLIKSNICTWDNVMDIINDTYIRINNFNTDNIVVEDERKVANYIIQAAKSTVIDKTRKVGVGLSYGDIFFDSEALKLQYSTNQDHSEIWRSILGCADEVLKDKHYQLFVDLFIHNKSEIAVSESKDVPYGTIKSDKSRMLMILKNNVKFKKVVSKLY